MAIQPVHKVAGGTRYFSQRSGILASQDNTLFSGQGRINHVIGHGNTTLSSQPVIIYDAVTAVSGAGANPNILAVIPTCPYNGNTSGQTQLAVNSTINVPFLSGLCVYGPSGSPGFTIVYTPNDPTVRS